MIIMCFFILCTYSSIHSSTLIIMHSSLFIFHLIPTGPSFISPVPSLLAAISRNCHALLRVGGLCQMSLTGPMAMASLSSVSVHFPPCPLFSPFLPLLSPLSSSPRDIRPFFFFPHFLLRQKPASAADEKPRQRPTKRRLVGAESA